MAIKTERDIVRNTIKAFGVIIALMIGGIFTRTVSLPEFDLYLSSLNITSGFLIFAYSLYCTMMSIKDCSPFSITFETFLGGLICLSYSVLSIFWLNTDQVLVQWLSMAYSIWESLMLFYIGNTISLNRQTRTITLRKECVSSDTEDK